MRRTLRTNESIRLQCLACDYVATGKVGPNGIISCRHLRCHIIKKRSCLMVYNQEGLAGKNRSIDLSTSILSEEHTEGDEHSLSFGTQSSSDPPTPWKKEENRNQPARLPS